LFLASGWLRSLPIGFAGYLRTRHRVHSLDSHSPLTGITVQRLGIPYCLRLFSLICVGGSLWRTAAAQLPVTPKREAAKRTAIQRTTRWQTGKLSKNECVFTLSIFEVNENLPSLFHLFSARYSPSTATCQLLVQPGKGGSQAHFPARVFPDFRTRHPLSTTPFEPPCNCENLARPLPGARLGRLRFFGFRHLLPSKSCRCYAPGT